MTTSKQAFKPVKKAFYRTLQGELALPDGATMAGHGKPKKSFRTVRKMDYRGRSVRVETTYRISIDREPFTRDVSVLDDGSVHCHDFPNYSFTSAMAMMRKVVAAQADFEPPKDEIGVKRHRKSGKSHKKSAKKG